VTILHQAENQVPQRPRQGNIGRMTVAFVPGQDLAREFYASVVQPLLAELFPGLRYSAALLGPGSEVLGFDSRRSTDHDWGPRLQIFLAAHLGGSWADRIAAALGDRLPATFAGYPVSYPLSGEPASAARHHVLVEALPSWLRGQLGFDPLDGIGTFDWLATPTQRLAELTGGAVFHDGLGQLRAVRTSLAWYPDDVWRYVLACQWARIGQEEPFAGRTGESGDELGSAVIAARLARDLMRLCLLMDRRYPPYSKWLGTAFARSPAGPAVAPHLAAALAADGWQAREPHLCHAMQAAAARHNELGLTGPIPGAVRRFYDRPYLVLDSGRFAAALQRSIADPFLRELPLAGAVDQFTDNTDALGDLVAVRASMAALLRWAS
jgi:hypothetical protein